MTRLKHVGILLALLAALSMTMSACYWRSHHRGRHHHHQTKPVKHRGHR